MFGRELDRNDHAKDLFKVAPSCHWVGTSQLDALAGPDDEDRAYGAFCAGVRPVRGIARIVLKHVVQFGKLQFRIADQRIGHRMAADVSDIGGPLVVIRNWIDAEADYLASLVKHFLMLEPQLSRSPIK